MIDRFDTAASIHVTKEFIMKVSRKKYLIFYVKKEFIHVLQPREKNSGKILKSLTIFYERAYYLERWKLDIFRDGSKFNLVNSTDK